jgi:hypothetical protein
VAIKTLSKTKHGVTTEQAQGTFDWRCGGARNGSHYYKVVFSSDRQQVTVAEYDGPDAQHFARLTAARLNGQL